MVGLVGTLVSMIAVCAGGRSAGDKTVASGLDKVGDTRRDDYRIRDHRWQRVGRLHHHRRQFAFFFLLRVRSAVMQWPRQALVRGGTKLHDLSHIGLE